MKLAKEHKPAPKFSVGEKVVISGTLTGFGDLEGVIKESEYSKHSKEYFYTIITEIERFYSQERFIKKL